jgi:hypothetical protein
VDHSNRQAGADGREEYRWIAALAGITALAGAFAVWAGSRAGVDALALILKQDRLIWTVGPLPVLVAILAIAVTAVMSGRSGAKAKLLALTSSRFGSPGLILGTAGPILLMQMLVGAFGVMKMVMPAIRPFSWDDRFAAADRALFLGHQPWELTHAIFGTTATRLIDSLYVSWIGLLFVAVLFFALFAPRYLRARFFLAFAATWLLVGSVGAYVFASAGPSYAAAIGAAAAPEFQALMARLDAMDAQHPLIAVQLQHLLWSAHVNHEYSLGMGISAMPSMHNGLALLYLLAVGEMGRTVRLICSFFLAVVFVGSIHLGWHYAVDGLIAFAMTWIIWKGAGAYLDWCGYSARVLEEAPAAGNGELVPAPAAT